MKINTAFIFVLVILLTGRVNAQEVTNNMRLKFINKVEVFAGSALSFNYGNKFIENFKDANIESRRLLKFGYVAGIGLHHAITKRVDINVRFQYEQKGRKTELNTPWTSTSRVITYKDYSYNYLTMLIAPQIKLGQNQKWVVSIGAFYSKIKGMKRYERVSFDNQTIEGNAKGRSFEDVDDNGGVYSGTWIPELQSFESDDYGIVGSLGYSVFLKKKQAMLIQLVDNFGLKNINKDNPYNQKEINHSISLMVSYILTRPIKNKN
jgi:hypothetical protein